MTGRDGVRIFSLVGGVLALFLLLFSATSIVENVDSGEIVVIQDVWDGDLHVYTEPGVVFQGFGTVTTYHHSNQFWFEPKVEGDTDDGAIRRGCFNMRFNDQGTAAICGSATFDLPTDEKSILALHRKFKSQEGIVQRLVKTGLSKSIYNTGPLMSSRESANEKRGDLIKYVIDQATQGIFQVEVVEQEQPDLGVEPTVTVTMVEEPVLDNDGIVKLDDEGEPVMHKVAKTSTQPAMKKVKVSQRPSKFKIDIRTESKVSHKDYTRSGYDRGHMAPNYAIASRYGHIAQIETFLMSNICPQTPRLNRRIWKNLEQKVAKEYAQDFEEIWIITGPIFDDNIEKLKSGVEVPDSFYKIIIDEIDGKPRVLAFIIPQEVKRKDSLRKFLVSIDEIEKLTKLDFLSELEDEIEEGLEKEKAEGVW